MPVYEIPFDSQYKFQEKTLDLSGEIFRAEFGFNERNQTWYINLYDSEGTPILLSHSMVLGTDLLKYKSGQKPSGVLGLYSNLEREIIPTSDNLGLGIYLVYAD